MSEDSKELPAAEENQSDSPEENQQQDSEAVTKSPGGMATLIAVVALLLAGASAGGVYYLYQQDAGQRSELASQLGAIQSRINDTQSRIDQQVKSQAAAQAAASEAQATLEKSLANLHEELGRDRNAWAIAETIYYLQLANARLQLLQDIDTALEALSLADKRLESLGDPGFIPVREKIKAEVAALEATGRVDFEGTALSLGAMLAQIPELPLHAPAKRAQQQVDAAESETAAEQQSAWKQEVERAWQVMRELVEIRRTDKRIEPLLKPEEQHLLVQNIQLQLQLARIALLQRNSKLYKTSLVTAAEWINSAYDLDADITRSTLEQINKMATLDIAPSMPDISASLRLLRNLADKQERKAR